MKALFILSVLLLSLNCVKHEEQKQEQEEQQWQFRLKDQVPRSFPEEVNTSSQEEAA